MIRLVLLRLLESYFQHRWLYLLPTVILGVIGVLYTNQMPAPYIARGTLYAQDKTLLASLTSYGTDGYSWVTPAQATVGEMRELLNTKAFLRAIAEQTDLEIKIGQGGEVVNEVIDEVQKAVWLQELGNNLISVSAAHEMPRVAHQLVVATVDTYVQWKININREDSVAAQEFFADLIKTYQQQVAPAREELALYMRDHPVPLRGERTEEETIAISRL
ncbi:MAG TPA: hypothetical protein P5121_21665, partial [Caldilineaceae bacterium]|nr:hypothetical protein [Caldilineaceae bacterium]